MAINIIEINLDDEEWEINVAMFIDGANMPK